MTLLSIVVFYALEIGARLYAGIAIGNETAAEAWDGVQRYFVQDVNSGIFLATPYILVGLLSARVAHRATLGKGLGVFGACALVLGWMYCSGQIDAMRAMNGRHWTAATLSVGLRPFLAIPIVIAAAVLQMLVVRKHRKDAAAMDPRQQHAESLGTDDQRPIGVRIFWPLGAGIMVPLLVNRTIGAGGQQDDFVVYLLWTCLWLALAAGFARVRLPGREFVVAAGLLVGTTIGLAIDAIFDEFVLGHSRNLFPLEIVAWWLLSVLSIPLGMSLQPYVSRKLHRT